MQGTKIAIWFCKSEERMDWELIQTFCAVMRGEGLNAASSRLDVSAATVSRRIKALEQELETTLFSKTAQGYRPTEAAQRLYRRAQAMESAAGELEREYTLVADANPGVVRIDAGNWISWLLARQVSRFFAAAVPIEMELQNNYNFVSLASNEADIAIRNTRPARGRYVCRRFRCPEFAIFGSSDFVDRHSELIRTKQWKRLRWAGLNQAGSDLPSQVWLRQSIGRQPEIRCSQAVNVLDAVAGGASLGVLPCFVATAMPDIVQLSEPLNMNMDGIWTVVHEDVRKRAAVQAALEVVESVLNDALSATTREHAA